MNIRHYILPLLAMLSPSLTAATEHTTVQGDHGLLDVIVSRPSPSIGKHSAKTPLLILCHGFGDKKENHLFDVITDSLNARGIAVLRFDFNGHGKSEGRFEDMTVPNEINDALQILRYASSLPWAGKIALGGHSQGGVVAAMTSGQQASHTEKNVKKIAAVVLMAPAAVLRDDALRGNTMGKMYDPKDSPQRIEMWDGRFLGAQYIRTATSLPIYETAQSYKGAECILHGDADRIVPYTYGQRFHYLNKKSEWHLLKNGDHGFGHMERQVAHTISLFLVKKLKP